MVEEDQPLSPAVATVGDDPIGVMEEDNLSADDWLLSARNLVPAAIKRAKSAAVFAGKWKLIVLKLQCLPPCISDLSSHPLFCKNSLCREQLQSVCRTLSEVIELAEVCSDNEKERLVGKLQMQSDLDAVTGRLDLNLRDCRLLVKSGVLGEAAVEAPSEGSSNIRELLARLQIGNVEAKHRAVEGLLELIKEDEKNVLAALGRSNIAALIQLLTTATCSPKIREKTATVICLLIESSSCEKLLVSEGVLPPLVRMAESGGLVGREKAVISLQRLSMLPETAKTIVGYGGVRPLIGICETGDSLLQAAAAGTLKNLSMVPEVRQTLAEEGVVGAMLNLLDSGTVVGSKEYAAECLQHLTSSNESLRRSVVSEGGIKSLLAYLDGPSPQESPVSALRNLVNSISPASLVSLGVLPTLIHVLQQGTSGAQQAAASAICKISSSTEMKKLIGELGCVPLLVKMLEAKTNGAREVAAQALASLMCSQHNAREAKRYEKSVPNLVQLLDHSPQNTAKKYAVACLLCLSSCKKCRKAMISYGAIGYLMKLVEMDVPGAKKLLERLERGKFRGFFSRK